VVFGLEVDDGGFKDDQACISAENGPDPTQVAVGDVERRAATGKNNRRRAQASALRSGSASPTISSVASTLSSASSEACFTSPRRAAARLPSDSGCEPEHHAAVVVIS